MKRASSYINNETNDPAASNARLVPATRLTVPAFVVEIGMTGPVLVEAPPAELALPVIELTVEYWLVGELLVVAVLLWYFAEDHDDVFDGAPEKAGIVAVLTQEGV
jgi:hypothetical protein